MELYQIRQHSRIDGTNRNPNAVEDLKFLRWNNTLGYMEYVSIGLNTLNDDGLVKKGYDSSAGNYVWKLDSSKNPDWREELYLSMVAVDGTEGVFTMSDGSEYRLDLSVGTDVNISAGNGMNFSNITGVGSVVLGTPSQITSSSSDSVSATSHTHSLDITGVTPGTYAVATITVDSKGRITAASEGSTSVANSQYSVSGDGSIATPFQLVNDVATPAVNQYYGTDATGTRGFFDITTFTGVTDEHIRDVTAAFIQDGTGISWFHDDPSDTLTPTITLNPFDTDDLSEGTLNLYYTDGRARQAISLVTSAGLSTMTYDNTSGIFTFNPVTTTQVRNLFSASFPIGYNASTGNISWLGDAEEEDPGNGTKQISQPSHGFSVLQAVRLDNTSGLWVLAQADSDINSGTMGIVKEIIDANNFIIQYSGILTVTPNPFAEGMWYFLSTTTAGVIEVEPTYNLGEVREFIGTGTEEGILLEIDLGDVITGLELGEFPTGTVTSVGAGNGMDFPAISASGNVTLGTPSTITSITSNGVTATSHTHALDLTGVIAGTYSYANITVDDKGRITNASDGSVPITVINVTNSITGDGSIGTPLKLVNDEASPSPNYYYGTNALGTLGYHELTGIGGSTTVNTGAGMDFVSFSSSGSVIMGTPTTLTKLTINQALGTSHEHIVDMSTWDLTDIGDVDNSPTEGDFLQKTASGWATASVPASGSWNLDLNGIFQEIIASGDNVNFKAGSNMNMSYDSGTNTLEFNSTAQPPVYAHNPNAVIGIRGALYSYDTINGTAAALVGSPGYTIVPELPYINRLTISIGNYIFIANSNVLHRYNINTGESKSVVAGINTIQFLVEAGDGIYAIGKGRCYHVDINTMIATDYGNTRSSGTTEAATTAIHPLTGREYIVFFNDSSRFHHKEIKATYSGSDTADWSYSSKISGADKASIYQMVPIQVNNRSEGNIVLYDVDNFTLTFGDISFILSNSLGYTKRILLDIPSEHDFTESGSIFNSDSDGIAFTDISYADVDSTIPTSYITATPYKYSGYKVTADQGIYLAESNLGVITNAKEYKQVLSAMVRCMHTEYVDVGGGDTKTNVIIGGDSGFVYTHTTDQDPMVFNSKEVLIITSPDRSTVMQTQSFIDFVYYDSNYTPIANYNNIITS